MAGAVRAGWAWDGGTDGAKTMALQSQMARSGTGSASRYSDSRGGGSKSGGKQLLGVVLLGVLVLGGGYWYMSGKHGGAKTTTDGASGGASSADTRREAGGVVGAGVPGSTLISSEKTLLEKGKSVEKAAPAPAAVIDMAGRAREGRDGRGSGQGAVAQQQSTGGAPAGSAPAPSAPVTPVQPPPPVTGGGGADVVRDPLAGGADGGAGGSGAMNSGSINSGVMNRAAMPAEVQALVAAGEKAKSEGRLLDARKQLNAALLSQGTSAGDRAELRRMIAELNETLVFSKAVAPGDTMSESYTVEKGDSLVKIARKKQTVSEPNLIARINGMSSPHALKVGQTLKLVRGPFHAVVSKSAFRMDVYEGPVPSTGSIGASGLPDGAEPGWTYVRSFTVGLGEKGVTPLANFLVKENSKLVNPFWVNPRTGEKFDADDPKNPIGERWIGLEGVNLKDKAFTGYGVHGTIDENSIGHEMSMGCVRMHSADVEMVYELLMPRVSVVKIVD